MLSVKVTNGRKGRPRVVKTAKDLTNGSLHLEIGIKHNGIAFDVT